MKLLGLSPGKIFSGFEESFFNALRNIGDEITHIEVEIPWFKLLCTFSSFYPNKKKWGTRRDLHYHTSIIAFNQKSAFAQRKVEQLQEHADAIYQVGSLWNPVSDKVTIPLFLQVDYTSILSKRRNSEWKRKPGRPEQFWIEQEKILYNTAAKVLTTTENARQSIINDYDIAPEHVVTVGAGVSAPYDKLDPDRKPDYASKKILFVGKGFIGKGLDTILEAFETVRKKIPDAILTVVGPTNFNIHAEGVHYLGRITDKEKVKELYYQHAVFVMPSRFEPLGQVFLEAMSCQLPCIGSTIDAMPEMIKNGDTGYIIEPGDSRQLAEHIITLLSNPDLAQKMGNAGFERLKKYYLWSQVGKRIHDEMSRHIR